VSSVTDERGRVGVHRQPAALLDHRLGERVGEASRRQRHLHRRAPSLLLGLVARDQGHLHPGARPRMGGEVADRLAGAVAGAQLRQRKRQLRRLEQRPGRSCAVSEVERGDLGLGGDHAVVVLQAAA
jgi:hypothetical protein